MQRGQPRQQSQQRGESLASCRLLPDVRSSRHAGPRADGPLVPGGHVGMTGCVPSANGRINSAIGDVTDGRPTAPSRQCPIPASNRHSHVPALAPVIEDPDRCYQAAQSKDARFDGQFFCAVTSTGIYCRPSCPARTPKRENMRFYATAAAAQQAGLPRLPALPARRHARLAGVEHPGRRRRPRHAAHPRRRRRPRGRRGPGRPSRLQHPPAQPPHHRRGRAPGRSPWRGPSAARRRASCWRRPTSRSPTWPSPPASPACASATTPCARRSPTRRAGCAPGRRGPRRAAAARRAPATQAIRLRLPCRQPFDPASVLDFLGLRALPGVEALDGSVLHAQPAPPPRARHRHPARAGDRGRPTGPAYVEGELVLSDLRDLQTAVARCRQLLDLDADPVAIWEALRDDPLVGALVRRDPGRRVPGAADGFELAVRAVIGQQVSVPGARTVAGRLVHAAGELLPAPVGAVTHLFPTPAALIELAGTRPRRLRHAGGPAARRSWHWPRRSRAATS